MLTALNEVEARLQSLDPDYQARHADGVHDLLAKAGRFIESGSCRARTRDVPQCFDDRRVGGFAARGAGSYRGRIPLHSRGIRRHAIAMRSGRRCRRASPKSFSKTSDDPLREILRSYARTHGPFTTADFAAAMACRLRSVESVLRESCTARENCWKESFVPAAPIASGAIQTFCSKFVGRVWRACGARLNRRSRVSSRASPLAGKALRFGGAVSNRCWMSIENLQGSALLASELEREILPARIADYRPGDLDTLMASGQVVWVGVEHIGNRDGRLRCICAEVSAVASAAGGIVWGTTSCLRARGKDSGFSCQAAEPHSSPRSTTASAADSPERRAMLCGNWSGLGKSRMTLSIPCAICCARTIRSGIATPLRLERPRVRRTSCGALRSRGGTPAQGRWSLIRQLVGTPITPTQWSANIAQQLLMRYGIVLRETAIAENIPRGYPTIYPALKTMEDSGWVRRGMFVAGLGAAQFAMPAAVDMLRSLRAEPETPEALFLAATDPANLYGTVLPWPRREGDSTANEEGRSRIGADEATKESLPQLNLKPPLRLPRGPCPVPAVPA